MENRLMQLVRENWKIQTRPYHTTQIVQIVSNLELRRAVEQAGMGEEVFGKWYEISR
jgi:hypothetical protein